MGLEGAGIPSNDIVAVSIDNILLPEVIIMDVTIGGPEFLVFLPHFFRFGYQTGARTDLST